MTSSPAERSLTFEEASRRARLIEVDRYDVGLDLTGLLDGDALRSTSTVRFTCMEPGQETFIDCVAQVEEVVLNGTPLDEGVIAEGRIRLAGLEAENVLVVRSVQHETGRGRGIHRSVDRADGSVYVWTSFEPDDARRAWACFDQPDLKATWAFTVTAPAAWTVLSNAGTASVDEQGEQRVWAFPGTPRLSSYNMVVNAGPLHELRSERGGYDLGLYVSQSLAPMLARDAEELFDITAAGLGFYGEQFAMRFPQRRYDQAFMPEMSGAMENYGCVTLSDNFIPAEPPTFTEREWRAKVVLHEMAHMWFGDIVTMRWWDDLWLNESFADWACHWSAERVTEFTDAWAGVTAARELAGYAADASPMSHPIARHLPDVAAAAGSFDAITYSKGQAALKQLVAYVGEREFVAGLRSYFAEHAWGSAEMADLVDHVQRACGRELTSWTRAWFGTAGTDRLEVRRDGAPVLVATGPDGGSPRPHRLHLGLYDAEGDALRLREKLSVEVTDETTALPEAARSGVLLVNDDDLTFASVRPDPESLRRLSAGAGGLPTAVGRVVAVTTAWDMLVHGESGTAHFLECALGMLAREQTGSVLEPVLDLTVQAADYWARAEDRDAQCAAVADVCLRLADEPSRAVPALRALARVAATPAQLAELERRATTRELGWSRLERLAALGQVDRGDIDAREGADSAPDAWLRAARARAALPDPTAKEQTWQAVVDHTIPSHSLAPVGFSFWRPGQERLLASFADRFLQMLPALGASGMLWCMALARGFFPTVGVDAAWLDRADALVGSGEVPPVLANPVVERIDRGRRMLRARGSGAIER